MASKGENAKSMKILYSFCNIICQFATVIFAKMYYIHIINNILFFILFIIYNYYNCDGDHFN